MSKLPIPAEVLAQHVIALGKTRAGKSSKVRVLVEYLLDEEKPVCIIDPKGDWWGLKSSADGKKAGYPIVIFGGQHADVPLNAHAGAALAELISTGNRPALIDVSDMMMGERTRFFVDFASNLFKWTRGVRHLVIDEVHNFAPKGKVFDPDSGKMLHWANKLAGEGAGKGVLLVAASQRPQKVHNDFLTSCETLIACKVIHPADRKAIKEWIDGCGDPSVGTELMGSIAGLQKPEAWVWSPEIDYGPKRVTWPKYSTYDSFKPQDRSVAKGERLAGWADVDLAEVRGKLAAAIKDAEDNDPKRLRGRIVELERQLSKPQELAVDVRALEREYERGKAEGLAGAAEAQRALLATARLRIDDALQGLEIAHAQLGPRKPAKHAPTPARVRPQASPPPRAPRPRIGSNGGSEKLSKAERLVLTALAQYPDGRTKVQVALLTRYAHTGGGFNNALSSLRSRSLIADHGEKLLITPAGEEALGNFEPLPRGHELLAYWLPQLSKAEREILQVLADAYPRELSKEEVAGETPTGYEPNGGGFNNALSRLRTLELISGRGALRASEDLF